MWATEGRSAGGIVGLDFPEGNAEIKPVGTPAWGTRGRRVGRRSARATCSSSPTLPVTIQACKEKSGVPPDIASFVLSLGATAKMNGTALYQGASAVFTAQVYGLPLTLGDQLTIVLAATLASVGTAGEPGTPGGPPT